MNGTRKARVDSSGNVSALQQLKTQPEEVQQWAIEMKDQFTTAEIREKISERTGIKLKYDYVYTRFCQWYQREMDMDAGTEIEKQFEVFGAKGGGEINSEQARKGMILMLTQRAVAKGDDRLALQILSECRKHEQFLWQKNTALDTAFREMVEEVKAQPEEKRAKCMGLLEQFRDEMEKAA